MPVTIGTEQEFSVGEAFVASTSPTGRFSVVFEDNGETAYVYAVDEGRRPANPIADAMLVYNVANVTDRERRSVARIVWSADGTKAGLLINRYSHAAFDFVANVGYCRTAFPAPSTSSGWTRQPWSDDVQNLFR